MKKDWDLPSYRQLSHFRYFPLLAGWSVVEELYIYTYFVRSAYENRYSTHSVGMRIRSIRRTSFFSSSIWAFDIIGAMLSFTLIESVETIIGESSKLVCSRVARQMIIRYQEIEFYCFLCSSESLCWKLLSDTCCEAKHGVEALSTA
jgi:hypothetical protein